MLAVVDASYINQTSLLANLPNVSILDRARKSSRLIFEPQIRPDAFIARKALLPRGFEKAMSIHTKKSVAHFAGEFRQVLYKEFSEVYWKWSTKRKALRLIIISQTPYQRSRKSDVEFRDPAYLFTTNFDLDAQTLIQKYVDRWQIEVNFREEKRR